ncbi:MAG TPA: hydrogenase 3 maturation endopeptidase HyCI [Myxococcales bacterium]|nr:hydrogenase 3 maturation endopeptidase HyCI [Myxococcales bacterium]
MGLLEPFPPAARVAVLGVGSALRGDDGAGLGVARRLQAGRARVRSGRLAAFIGHTAPENLTGEIARFRPTHLVLVDAADLGREPGAVELVPRERIAGASFSTHALPLPLLIGYLERATGCRSIVVGIQPAQLGLMRRLSPEVQRAVGRVVADIRGAIKALRARPPAPRSRPGGGASPPGRRADLACAAR